MKCLQDDERFGFQPGQWVDFHAPGVATIGGYSIVSPPSQLKCHRTCDIAVKESRHPPALWVHTEVYPAFNGKAGGESIITALMQPVWAGLSTVLPLLR